MSAPVSTEGVANGALASQSLAASGNVSAEIDALTKIAVALQVKSTGGASVAATNGVQIDIYRVFVSTGGQVDTTPLQTFSFTTVASATRYFSFELPTGRWSIKLTNLDTVNAVTVGITQTTVDS